MKTIDWETKERLVRIVGRIFEKQFTEEELRLLASRVDLDSLIRAQITKQIEEKEFRQN